MRFSCNIALYSMYISAAPRLHHTYLMAAALPMLFSPLNFFFSIFFFFFRRWVATVQRRSRLSGHESGTRGVTMTGLLLRRRMFPPRPGVSVGHPLANHTLTSARWRRTIRTCGHSIGRLLKSRWILGKSDATWRRGCISQRLGTLYCPVFNGTCA